jgi:D-galacturonate reductase
MKLLIIGGGIYVKGSKYNENGTIIPSIIESIKEKHVEQVCFVTTSSRSVEECIIKSKKLSKLLKVKITSRTFIKFKSNSKTSYKKALKEFKPDATIVATPDHTHYKICRDVILSNSNLLVVKPLSNKAKEVSKLIKMVKNKKKIYQVEFHKRLDEANLTLKKFINEKKLGELKYCVIEYSQKKIIPEKFFKDWSNKSNSFQYLGVHYIDLIYFMTKFEPLRVWAWGQKGYLNKKGINTWDAVQATIEWKGNGKNFFSHIITNWIDPNNSSATSDQKINFVGEKGRFYSDQKNRGIFTVSDDNNFSHINPYFTNLNFSDKYFFDGYGIKNIKNFLKEAKENKNNNLKFLNSSFYDSIVSTKIIEAVNRSLKNNSQVIHIK